MGLIASEVNGAHSSVTSILARQQTRALREKILLIVADSFFSPSDSFTLCFLSLRPNRAQTFQIKEEIRLSLPSRLWRLAN